MLFYILPLVVIALTICAASADTDAHRSYVGDAAVAQISNALIPSKAARERRAYYPCHRPLSSPNAERRVEGLPQDKASQGPSVELYRPAPTAG